MGEIGMVLKLVARVETDVWGAEEGGGGGMS